jgi:hypothetical protein
MDDVAFQQRCQRIDRGDQFCSARKIRPNVDPHQHRPITTLRALSRNHALIATINNHVRIDTGTSSTKVSTTQVVFEDP